MKLHATADKLMESTEDTALEMVEDTVAIVVERVSGGWKKAFGFGGNGGGGGGDGSSAGKAERIGKNNAGTVHNNSRGKNRASSLRSSNGQRSDRSNSTPAAKKSVEFEISDAAPSSPSSEGKQTTAILDAAAEYMARMENDYYCDALENHQDDYDMGWYLI